MTVWVDNKWSCFGLKLTLPGTLGGCVEHPWACYVKNYLSMTNSRSSQYLAFFPKWLSLWYLQKSSFSRWSPWRLRLIRKAACALSSGPLQPGHSLFSPQNVLVQTACSERTWDMNLLRLQSGSWLLLLSKWKREEGALKANSSTSFLADPCCHLTWLKSFGISIRLLNNRNLVAYYSYAHISLLKHSLVSTICATNNFNWAEKPLTF